MKLFTRYSRVNLLAMIIVFLLSVSALYVVIRFILVSQVDQDLTIEENEIKTYVRQHDRLPESISVRDQVISYAPAQKSGRRTFRTVREELAGDEHPHHYRELRFPVMTATGAYEARVVKSLSGTEALLKSIVFISAITILLILAVSFLVNRFLLRRLWAPFYGAISAMRRFRLEDDEVLELPETRIEEFGAMNAVLQSSTEQARREYSLLKEFTDNASHEMQTPLAIMRSKLDLFIQDENLTEGQSKTIQAANAALEKLARLNQSLLLLTKIENNQFAASGPVDLRQKIEEKIDGFHELWQNQSVILRHTLQPASILLNVQLVDILLNNLFSNATIHNFGGGEIAIDLRQGMLVVSNTSEAPALDADRVFTRFYRGDAKSSHHGLGLSIIREICVANQIRVDYRFQNDRHSFVLTW